MLGMIKVLVLNGFRMSMAIWVRFRHLGLQGLGPDQGESHEMDMWKCLDMLLKPTLFGMMKIVIRSCLGIPKNVLDYSIGSMLAERATRSVAS